MFSFYVTVLQEKRRRSNLSCYYFCLVVQKKVPIGFFLCIAIFVLLRIRLDVSFAVSLCTEYVLLSFLLIALNI